ncbi:MAG: hypothetical protein WCP28_10915 [Actinomycetes bacterium]
MGKSRVTRSNGDSQSKNHKKPKKPKKPRNVTTTAKDGVGEFERVEAALDQPTIWKLERELPGPAATGSPRKLPEIFYPMMEILCGVFGSYRGGQSALQYEPTWEWFCDLMAYMHCKYNPDLEEYDVGKLKATNCLIAADWVYAREHWCKAYVHRLVEIAREDAAMIALELGYADPDEQIPSMVGRGLIKTGPNNLSRGRAMFGDGKVTREVGCRHRLLTPEEALAYLRQRHPEKEPSKDDIEKLRMACVVDRSTKGMLPKEELKGGASVYKTGKKDPKTKRNEIVIGYKTAFIGVRGNHSNDEVILDVRPVDGSEAAVATDMAIAAKRQLPGLLALCYDGALTGVYLRLLAREHVIGISPIAAKSVTKDRHGDDVRTEKSGFLAVMSHDREGHKCVHTYHHHGGAVVEVQLDANGKQTKHYLPDPKIELRTSSKRIYVVYYPTCTINPDVPPIKLQELRFNIAEDELAGAVANISENVRALPPGSDIYDAVYGWREAAENYNQQSDNAKYMNRARATTAERAYQGQAALMINKNGLARRLHYERLGMSPPAETRIKGNWPTGDLAPVA